MSVYYRALALTKRISITLLGYNFSIRIEHDVKGLIDGRPFIQILWDSPCSKTGSMEAWKGRKWYLSEHMTDDEIVKTIYAAFELAVRHEVMEGFKVDGITLFNPHVDFEELLKISHKEVQREMVL